MSRLTKTIVSGVLVATLVTSAFAVQFNATETNESQIDYEKANIQSEEYSAGGFTSDDTRKVDSDYKYYFEVDSVKEAKAVATQFGLDKDEYELSDKLNGKVIVQADVTKTEAQQIENSPLVDSVEKNYNVNGCAETEQGSALTQWYLDAMNVGETSQTPENKVKVELLDSGVSYVSALENVRHVSLIDDECGNPLFTDYNGHGTALAGLIAGNSEDFKGVNPNAKLYDVQVLDNNLQAPISKIIEGIYWGIDNDVDIINMSFGTDYDSEILHSAISAAYNAGIMLIAAAGNDSEAGVMYPAAYPEVIAVGSTDSDGEYVVEYAGIDSTELAAPGTQIVSTGILDGYSTGCGTSLSTAEVTGIASRLLEEDGATADFVRYLMKSTGRTVADSSARLVDLGSALENYDSVLADYTENPAAPVEYVNNSEPESYDVGGIVTGLWSSTTHVSMIGEANNGYVVNNTYIANMNFAAGQSDIFRQVYLSKYDLTYINTGVNNKKYGGMHGFGVYTTNLKALWKFANYVNSGNNRMEAYNNAMTAIQSDVNYLNNNNIFTSSENTPYGLLHATRKFHYWAESQSGANMTTSAYRKYLIVGIALHAIADTYAHRTLIPDYLIENTKYKNGMSSYASQYNYNVAHNHDEYISPSHFKSGGFDDFKNDSNNSTTRNRMTFEYLKTYLGTNSQGQNYNYNYVDVATFCNERYDASVSSCSLFLNKITQSGNSATNANIKAIMSNNYTDVSLVKYSDYSEYYN